MPRYKVTVQTGLYTMGGSETYYTGDGVTPSVASNQINVLLQKRKRCLFDTTYFQGIRISVVDNRRRSIFLPPGEWPAAIDTVAITVPEFGDKETTSAENRQDQWRACLQCRLTYDTDRQAIRYLIGVSDAAISREPLSVLPGNAVDWFDRFNEFRTELTSGRWHIKARNRAGQYAPIPVKTWRLKGAAGTTLGAVVDATPAPGFVDGEKVTIQGTRRKGTDKLSYNGTYFVDSLDSTVVPGKIVVYLRGTEGADPNTVKVLGTIQRIASTFYPITLFQALRAGIHKRGRPSSAPRGRRLTRVSLDP